MAASPPPSESLGQALPSQNPNIPQHEDRPQSPSHSDSHPSKTLTLESPIVHSPEPHRSPQNPHGPDQNDGVFEGLSGQTPRPSNDDGDLSSVASAAIPAFSVYKRGTKRKSGHQKKRWAQEKLMKKLEVLNENLRPIPFAPVKNLDFLSHEKLLRRLGLWDFVHIEFDRAIRADLLAQLIANYAHRCSYVNGVRVMVNRADLARALKLPVKKPAAATSEGMGDEVPETEEAIGFIEDFVSNWLLLHDDTWMTPNEVLNWMMAVKEGHLEKVDWAGIIWFMIEKELMAAPLLTDCYYASHLQYLIKSQKEELFLVKEGGEEGDEEEPKIEILLGLKEDEEVAEGEDANGDVRMGGDDTDVRGHELEEHNTELSLGQDNVVEHNVELSLGQDNVVEEADAEKEVDVENEKQVDVEKEADAGQEELVEEKKEAGVEEKKEEGVEEKEEEGVEEKEEEGVEEKEEEGVEEKEEEGVGKNEEEGIEGKGEDGAEEKEEDGGGKKEEQVVGEESTMDFEGCKEDDEPVQWFLDGKGNVGEPFLRQCSFGVEPKDLVCEDERKQEEEGEEVGGGEEEEEEEEEEGRDEVEEDEEEMEEEQEEQGHQEGDFHLSPKGFPLDGLTSGGLIHSMEAAQINLSPGMSFRDPLAGEFLTSRDDTRMSSLFGNGSTSKRDHISLESDNSHHALNGNKRMRIDGPWDNSKSSSDFDMCMEQIQHFMGKARMMYAAKEQACEEAAMNHQIFLNELQQRDNMIAHLEKARTEERQKRQIEVYRLEGELNLMSNLLDGYRKALKENHRAFAEYRARRSQLDEPIYKDVAGSAGLVLSATELGKLRLKREEEERVNRLIVERKIKEFEAWWDAKFSALGVTITEWDNKLLSVEQEMKLLKESYHAKRKVSEAPEPAQNDS
ncbi:hypothetical protein L484_002990 [Morus notabilis]|uniref:Uncharacterized protein n=1 Tax=Morus notabilis TaxID=981085 RepID=W9QY54_9ROSA|nr:stress response protein NST1 [Morus notabilis]EXB28790.1 hypothetical protein L484_002990 [Morus notabilis]